MSKLEITLVRSTNNASKKQLATVKALGLKKIGQSVVVDNNPVFQGMVRVVNHLVRCEEK